MSEILKLKMSDCEKNSPIQDVKSSRHPEMRMKSFLSHISEDSISKNETNDNLHSHGLAEGDIKAHSSDDCVTRIGGISQDMDKNSKHFGDVSNALSLHPDISQSPDCNYELDKVEYSVADQPIYDPIYTPKIEKNWLEELDETDEDTPISSRKKKLTWLQITVLTICGLVLSIVVIYFDREPIESVRKVV